jgi:serine/threonine-protein kinase
MLVVDELVMDRFRLLERIGSGGMGVVYRAFDERLQREVAVKEVTGGTPERVMREAQAAARLNHPGIVTLYELGERDGRPILVSELVPGRTLADLHRAGELTDRDVAELALDLAEALAHAHERGVVHRDIKPQNVVVCESAAAPRRGKLMDFGIARVAGAPTLTEAGEVVGTLAYMSPEQAEGEIAGPPSDVYSLALVAYECLTGSNPVAAATPAQTARRIGAPVPSLRSKRPDLPEPLVDYLDACLSADPAERPGAEELCDCLEAEARWLDDDPVPLPEGADPPPGVRASLSVARVGILATAGLVLAALAALGGTGLALVGVAILLPLLVIGAPGASLAAPAGALLWPLGLASATPALGASASGAWPRAILGAAIWLWGACAWIALGAGPDPGVAERAAPGWASDASLAAREVLVPLASAESLAAAAVFALAGASLGAVLRAAHVTIALLGAMIWAAAVQAALGLVAGGTLGGAPGLVLLGAAGAVVVEFGLARRTQAPDRRPEGRMNRAPAPILRAGPGLSDSRI